MPIKFGTDGWRALMDGDFTFANVRICARATAELLQESGMANRGLLIGYDTRLNSENFALTVAEVVARSGIAVTVTDGHVPTPMLSHGVVDRRAGGGVVITASHNPPAYNGYKYKPSNGGSAPDETVARLEHHIRQLEATGGLPKAAKANTADVARVDLAPRYLEHIGNLVDLGALRSAGLKVAADPMYGSGLGLFPRILTGGSTSVTEIHGTPDPAFPDIDHPEPIGQHLSELSGLVSGAAFDIGIANDGDADRLGLIDEKGRFVTTLETFSLLCLYQLEVLGRRGALVRSLTQSVMVDKLAAIYGVPVTETKVGFKHIAPLFQSLDALIAGEESGGYTVRGHVPERDGILCGLLMLDLMVRTGKRMSELVDWLTEMVGPHHFNRVDLTFPPQQRDAIEGRVRAAKPDKLAGLRVEGTRTDDGYKFNLAGGYWMLVRFSGTEPLLRTYAEADSPERVADLLDEAHRLAFA
jgi:phosphomannomutase